MKKYRNILLITDRNTDSYELIRTNAPDSVIKTEVEYFKSCQQLNEESLIGDNGNYYPIINGLGYEVECLFTEQEHPLSEVSLNMIDQVFDYSNDYVEITIYQHEHNDDEKEQEKQKIKELEVSNEMLRKAILQLTSKITNSDVRVSRKDFVKIHTMTVEDMFDKVDNNEEDNEIYGYPVTVHWHGIYCDCSDGATPSNLIIPAIEDCDDELCGMED